jgi:dynein heavy chain
VEVQINIPKLFDLSENAEKQLSEAFALMKQGSAILNLWKNEYEHTKNSFEEDQNQIDHWEFTPKPMTERLTHMLSIIKELMKITDSINRFLVFLGPKLKSVTGNSEGIDKLIDEVKEMVHPFQSCRDNFFEKANSSAINTLISAFKQNQEVIENKTIKLIDDTFKDLRSSEGAFDLLNNFKNIETLEQISNKLQKKYSDVLITYKRELESNKRLFDKGREEYSAGRESLIISRGNPPIAGVISWAKGIMQRIKSPMVKFNRNSEIFEKDKAFYENVRADYLRIIKEIDLYQMNKFREWEEKNLEKALGFLKAKILEKTGPHQYRVNFSDDFRVLIKETKQLEKMNHKISKTIINIAFQEKEYYRYVDKLKIMLKEYDESVHTLTPIERKLLEGPINELDSALQKGYDSKNLSSLGINEFILDCRSAITLFKDKKKKVNKNAGMIEDIIHSIESAVILREFDFEARRRNPLNPTEFCAYFEEHMQRVVGEMSDKYKIIGEQFLKAIEEGVLNTSTRCSEKMREYYYYWERRVYNALFKMILRALLTFKALITQIKGKPFTLFTIQAEYEHPRFIFKPDLPELFAMLSAFNQKIVTTSKAFWRWMDGYCEFCKPSKGQNDEENQKHTFLSDIENNKVIVKIIYDTDAIIIGSNTSARDF